MYIFTDTECNVVEKVDNATLALFYRKHLEEIKDETIIAWSHMGGDNPQVPVKFDL